MAMIGRPTGWENTNHATLALPAADTLQGFVIQDDWSILASQGVPTGDHEDSWISKHIASAPVQTMIALGAGHGAILGGLAHDKVLFDFNGKLVLAPWRPGNISRTSQGVKDWGGVFQSGNMSAVIDRRWGTACFYHHDKKTVVLRALADVETQTDRPLGKAGPLVNRSPAGRLTLRQGWAIYNRQLFYLIGDHAGGQELISYDLATGRLLWRFPAKLCGDVAWQEPQGLFVSDLGVLSGNPMIYVGFTNRIGTGDSFVRQHVIKRLRDPASVLTPHLTSPAMP